MKKFNIILETDKLGGIGKNNILPWNFIEDTEYFYNKVTTNLKTNKNILIIGYKSFLNFDKNKLNKVILYVIANNASLLNSKNTNSNILYFNNFEKAIINYNGVFRKLQHGENPSDFSHPASPLSGQALQGSAELLNYTKEYSDIWILGGKKIYEEALSHPLCDKIYLTLINDIFDCDVIVDLSKYNIIWDKETSKDIINDNDNKIYRLLFKEGRII